MAIRYCPCCEQPCFKRGLKVSDAGAEYGYLLMKARGWTAQRLLAERLDDLDWCAPGLSDWLRRKIAAEGKEHG